MEDSETLDAYLWRDRALNLAKDNARLRDGLHQLMRKIDDCPASQFSQNRIFILAYGKEVLAATDSPSPTQTKEQAVIQILREALNYIKHPHLKDINRSQDIARDALSRADAAGKGEK